MNTAYISRCQVGDLADDQEVLTGPRRHLHQNPEPSIREAATAAPAAARLAETYLAAA